MALFGSAFVLGKLVLNTNVPPLLFGSLRMLVVLICLVPFFKFQFPKKEYLKSLIIFSLSMGVCINKNSFPLPTASETLNNVR